MDRAQEIALDKFRLGKHSQDWFRLLQTRMQILIRMGNKDEEVLEIAKEAFEISKCIYGDK
jgi:hypothetical protein